MKKQQIQNLLPFSLAPAFAGVMVWYYDIYVNWNSSIFPFAVAASSLAFLALAFSVIWPGKEKLGKKCLQIFALLLSYAAVLLGLSILINNVIYDNKRPGASVAMRFVLPLLALLVILLLIKPWRALSRKTKRGMAISLVVLACGFVLFMAIPANIPINAGEFVSKPEVPVEVEKNFSIEGFSIIYGPGAGVTEIAAAGILADTLSEITEDEFIAGEAAPTGLKEILVRSTADLGSNGYRIMARGESIVIEGGQRGVVYGAYRFLEKYFDCHWYTADLRVIPRGPAMIAQVVDEQFIPPFEYREMDMLSRADVTFSAANGLNGNNYRTMPEELGGTFGYNGLFCHTIINLFLRPDEFFDRHPDWYAWREDRNERVPRQLCLTNPEVLAQMIVEVRNQLEYGNGQPIVSVTQDDNEDFCQCAECKRVDEEEGSQAGTMLRFVNAIADDIKDDYPDALIDTFAYMYTRRPPKYMKPLPNVIVRLCSVECCFAHPLGDSDCAVNAEFAADLKGWSEISGNLYIWDYTTNYAFYNCVFPNFGVLQANMRFFAGHNVRGVYAQGNYQAAECDSEFAELRGYLLARLLWNPDIDYYAEMDGFLRAWYGGGWQYICEFIDLITANAGADKPHNKMGIYINPRENDLLNLTAKQIAYADTLWEKAIELADDETREHNVLRSRLSWRFWKGCNRVAEFDRWKLPPFRWPAASEQLYNDFIAFGITRFSEEFMLEPPTHWWGTPDSWRAWGKR